MGPGAGAAAGPAQGPGAAPAAGERPARVEIVRDGGVARVWLNRPEVRNAFDAATIAELGSAFEALSSDSAVRVIVLGGRGAAFCAGGDLNWMKASARFTKEENHADALRLARMLESIRHSPQPVIARVHGDAFGGGVGLICAADIAIGTWDARCALSEVRLGLLPATIAPHVLAAIGSRAASRYMLTAERIGSEEALRIGLLHEVVAPDALDSTIDALVRSLLANGPQALAATKALIREVSGRALDEALLQDTAARIAAARASAEGAEGIAAFLEKRKPRWAP